jgi:hypothetical protein
MHILEHKKRNHIGSYIIAMWHLEDLFRAQQLDKKKIFALLVPEKTVPEERVTAEKVYSEMVDQMVAQGIQAKGHLASVNESLAELQFLHDTLLNLGEDKAYMKLYNAAKPGISDLQKLGDMKQTSEMEACFNGIYGVMLLRSKGSEISEATSEAEQRIRELLDGLSERYKQMRTFPDVSLN